MVVSLAPRIVIIVRWEKVLRGTPSFNVVVMPDFYLDYLIYYPGGLEELASELDGVARRGGGSIVGWKHTVGRGGNACNMVAQLARLGVPVVPIVETDELGLTVMEKSLPSVDLSHVKASGVLSSTLSLEVTYSGRRVNIMASNPGSLSTFGPEKLTQEDKDLILHADFVCVVNWGKNLKGTDLSESVFQLARQGRGVTFFDPADPTSRAGDVQGLKHRVLTNGLVDILSVNETELLQLSSPVMVDSSELVEATLLDAARVFSTHGVRVDLHTPEFSATVFNGQTVRAPCLKFQPVKVTGAGDIWNAADIYAQGMGLNHDERLVFANAAAAAYLKRPGLEPPSLQEILREANAVEKTTANSKPTEA